MPKKSGKGKKSEKGFDSDEEVRALDEKLKKLNVSKPSVDDNKPVGARCTSYFAIIRLRRIQIGP